MRRTLPRTTFDHGTCTLHCEHWSVGTDTFLHHAVCLANGGALSAMLPDGDMLRCPLAATGIENAVCACTPELFVVAVCFSSTFNRGGEHELLLDELLRLCFRAAAMCCTHMPARTPVVIMPATAVQCTANIRLHEGVAYASDGVTWSLPLPQPAAEPTAAKVTLLRPQSPSGTNQRTQTP